jgi:hypothetical protein
MAVTTVEFGKRHYHLQEEMIKWCKDNLGNNPRYSNWVFATPVDWTRLGNWCVSSAFGSTSFHFKNESDATMFALRWK